MEDSRNTVRKEELRSLLEEWEESYGNWANPQLTHIMKDPKVKEIIRAGKDALPLLFKGLEANIVYSNLIERIVLDEYGVEIEPVDIPPSEGKFGHLERNRQGCLKWARENQDKI